MPHVRLLSQWLAVSHVFLTQLMQSEAVGHAYRSWRREWRGKGKEFVSIFF